MTFATYPIGKMCESNTRCQHVVPDDVYASLNSWRRGRDYVDKIFIRHEDCLEDLVVLKHEGVWCAATEDPE